MSLLTKEAILDATKNCIIIEEALAGDYIDNGEISPFQTIPTDSIFDSLAASRELWAYLTKLAEELGYELPEYQGP